MLRLEQVHQPGVNRRRVPFRRGESRLKSSHFQEDAFPPGRGELDREVVGTSFHLARDFLRLGGRELSIMAQEQEYVARSVRIRRCLPGTTERRRQDTGG